MTWQLRNVLLRIYRGGMWYVGGRGQADASLWCLSRNRHYCPAPKGQGSLPRVLGKAKEAKNIITPMFSNAQGALLPTLRPQHS